MQTTKRLFSKAATLLLMMVLTTATAWADADVIVKYLDPTAAMGAQRKSVTNPGQITAETTAIGTADTETWYYVSGEVTNNNRIEVSGTVNLILVDGCDFTVSKGIHVASGNALNIYAQSVANRGSLTANNYALPNYAAIGGNGGDDANGTTAGNGETAGDITIYGGTITTENSNIGGGNGGNGYREPGEPDKPGNGGNGGNGNVTIYSGNITVSGNIGGGSGGKGQDEYGQDDVNNGSNGGGTVNLSWTNTEDRIYANCYYGTVTLQKDFTVGNNVHDAGELNNNQDINALTFTFAGTYYIVTIGSMPEGVTATADLELNAGWKNAVEGQVVTICFSNVPDGKVPVISVTYGNNNEYIVPEIFDNGDGTVSFAMPAADVTVTASELKKDIKSCTAEVPDQTLERFGGGEDYSYMYFKFEDAENNPTSNVIGEVVKDGETPLKLGEDYEFGQVMFNGESTHSEKENPCKAGDKCLVEIKGIGDYAGSIYAPFTIIGAEVSNQTWGDLTWSLSNGELSISLTTPANGNKPMPETNREGYPWHPFGSYITSITINEGITSIAANAFASTSNVSTYGGVTTVSLPSTLTSIGDYAFDHCTGATITISTSVTTFGSAPFNHVGTHDVEKGIYADGVVASLSDTGDNNALINALSSAKNVQVTLNGRTLYKDGNWNTLCLPFNMTNAQVTAQLAPYELKELDLDGYYDAKNDRYIYIENEGKYYHDQTPYDGDASSFRQTGFDATSGALNLFFKDATSIEAGKPYLIKWNKPNDYVAYNGENAATCSDLVNPVFTNLSGITIETAPIAATSPDGKVSFKGTYSKKAFTDVDNSVTEDKSVLFLGASNTLYYPISNGNNDYSFNAFRAYFQLNGGLTVGDPAASVKAFNLNFGEKVVDKVGEVQDAEANTSLSTWYDLNGRQLSSRPTKRGLYINNGQKTVIN